MDIRKPSNSRFKIIEPGMETFTGDLGVFAFENGVTTQPLNVRDAELLMALVRVEVIDGDFESVGQRSQSMRNHHVDLVKLERASDVDKAAENARDELARFEKEIEGFVFHTEDFLSAVADKDGIRGLRVIADPMGVRGKAIQDLIAAILKHEAEIKDKWEKLKEAVAENTAEAVEDAA